ncbi:Sugar kinase of the NBD/HSP70 family, may contain an N-terminal HTH domain [Spirosomataceae bacterium TFI 002]|nr:Sugar kinase of the NBD/HSP70 family, may contain an N-terminal HTH domain [Spirosomataceae bacterium TFI 002]
MPAPFAERDTISLVDHKKNQNLSKILKHLYLKNSSSIAQLSKHINASVPSTTTFVNELLENGIIKELGASKTKSGRRPVFFAINGASRRILVISINIFEVTFFITDLDNTIIEKDVFEINIKDTGYKDFIESKVAEILRLNSDIWAAGISAPGLVDKNTGINYTHSTLNFDAKTSLSCYLREKTKIPFFTINDTQASIIGEHHYGLAKGKRNVVSINLDWGIGMGIMVNGKILGGNDGFAGELGHMQIDPNGTLCTCGKIGCLDTVASASTVVRRAKEGIAKGRLSTLTTLKNDIDLQSVVQAANKGDEFSIDILYDLGRELGKGLSVAVHLLNPEAVIIDGILTSAGDLIVSTLKQSINKYCLTEFKKDLKILVSPLKDMAKIYGVKSHVYLKMITIN